MRRGDDAAFGVLFERYRRRLIVFATGMVGDHGRAEDVTQEVFISALRRLRATDAPIAFKPWIYEIARNACIDTFRRSRRADEVSLDVEEGPAAVVVAHLANAAPGPVAALDGKERLADLRGAFGGLSDAERDALVMRELEGRSYREIGKRLEMGRPAVESTLFRARRRLEIEYEELRSGERCRRVQGIVAAADAEAGARGPGIRDARRLARHVSHCQPCRRAALAAGMAVDQAEGRPLRSRIAGLLPVPAFLRPEGGALASLAGYAEPITAWAKALAAAATVTAVGLGAGMAVEERLGVPLAAGGGQAMIESVTGVGPGEPGWADGVRAAYGTRGTAGAIGGHEASGAPVQDRNGSGRDDAASGDAAHGPSPRNAGTPATAPGAGDPAARDGDGPLGGGLGPTGLLTSGGGGRGPTGLLTGGGPLGGGLGSTGLLTGGGPLGGGLGSTGLLTGGGPLGGGRGPTGLLTGGGPLGGGRGPTGLLTGGGLGTGHEPAGLLTGGGGRGPTGLLTGGGLGTGHEPAGLLTGGEPALPAAGEPPPGGLEGVTLDRPLLPPPPAAPPAAQAGSPPDPRPDLGEALGTAGGYAPDPPPDLGEVLGPAGGDALDLGVGGRLSGGAPPAGPGPQASAPAVSPTTTVRAGIDTPQVTAPGASGLGAELPSRAPEPDTSPAH